MRIDLHTHILPHTWPNLQDQGPKDPPRPFDFGRYLDFLVERDHNVIRLWAWEQARWAPWSDGKGSNPSHRKMRCAAESPLSVNGTLPLRVLRLIRGSGVCNRRHSNSRGVVIQRSEP